MSTPERGTAPKGVGPVFLAAILSCAAATAIVGAILPDLAGLTGPRAIWLPILLYAAAAGQVLIGWIIWTYAGPASRASMRDASTVQRER